MAAPYINKSKTDLWSTSTEFLQEITKGVQFFDPCPENPTFDGLTADWSRDLLNYVNPPYSNLRTWTAKCVQEFKNGCEIKLLMPARVSAIYFHENVLPYASIHFVRGKRRFISQKTGLPAQGKCPFDLIICHYKPSHRGVSPTEEELQVKSKERDWFLV